jgi:ubiquinone/menaquinone biosynthesis C-methylase UbiE
MRRRVPLLRQIHMRQASAGVREREMRQFRVGLRWSDSTAEVTMSHANRISFKMMSFMHETLYGLFRDPSKTLTAAGLRPGQKVLEVGCGPGFFTVPAARIVGEEGSVLALDVNPLAVEKVRQKLREQGVTNVKTLLANVSEANLPDQSFDLIFAFGLARPIGSMERIWAALDRLLKPAGILSVEGRLRPPDTLFQPVKRQGRISQYSKVGQA